MRLRIVLRNGAFRVRMRETISKDRFSNHLNRRPPSPNDNSSLFIIWHTPTRTGKRESRPDCRIPKEAHVRWGERERCVYPPPSLRRVEPMAGRRRAP
ncbi:hypothetical protein CDAR_507501 [Caerostris darwini]|uniref:Uncharacterized protein n=1 Tax=Caerostris darwini TaxID=1538125 RepID=A0AAV4MXK4_9ARAC|nr:hypothetical protein CDAR_507501 [Caerostris darwini]